MAICCRALGGGTLSVSWRSCVRYSAVVSGNGCRLLTAACPGASGDIFKEFVFLAMPFLPQVACQNFAGTPGNKGDDLAKNFSSQRDGLALQFL
jgi:hypothetical protein